jgi:predicted acylesterase/phospholipase RssA
VFFKRRDRSPNETSEPAAKSFTFEEVFRLELTAIAARRLAVWRAEVKRKKEQREKTPALFKPSEVPSSPADLYKHAFACKFIGLSLSGGGIRSAAFSLGVLQALSHHSLLRWCDYLSTVSGGGYIGACLSSLLSQSPCPLRMRQD